MAKDLRQAEADRELMLAGISHDLRTPLARMRLEIELSGVSEDARQAIDEDLGQIDHSIGQLMEYARPAGTLPQLATDISAVLAELYERERSHTAPRWAANWMPRWNPACARASPRWTSSASSAT